MAGYYLIHSIDFWEKINLTHEPSKDLFVVYRFIYVFTRHGGQPWASALAAIRPGRRPDIVAKDLTEARIILSLYFTIFLNQLDILFPYTPNGTSRPVPTLNDGPRLLTVWLRRSMMFGRVSAGWFSRLFSRQRSEGAGVVACAAAVPLVVLALAVDRRLREGLPLQEPRSTRGGRGLSRRGGGDRAAAGHRQRQRCPCGAKSPMPSS